MEGYPKLVEFWRWRCCDPETGRIWQNLLRLSEREAAELLHAQRIEGSMLLREPDGDDFPETDAEVHRLTLTSPQSP